MDGQPVAKLLVFNKHTAHILQKEIIVFNMKVQEVLLLLILGCHCLLYILAPFSSVSRAFDLNHKDVGAIPARGELENIQQFS